MEEVQGGFALRPGIWENRIVNIAAAYCDYSPFQGAMKIEDLGVASLSRFIITAG